MSGWHLLVDVFINMTSWIKFLHHHDDEVSTRSVNPKGEKPCILLTTVSECANSFPREFLSIAYPGAGCRVPYWISRLLYMHTSHVFRLLSWHLGLTLTCIILSYYFDVFVDTISTPWWCLHDLYGISRSRLRLLGWHFGLTLLRHSNISTPWLSVNPKCQPKRRKQR